MDAATLYTIVQLANGELKTADAMTLPTNRESCAITAQEMGPRLVSRYMRRGAKRVLVYCGPTYQRLVIAR